jgi:hypothetical protein
VASLKDLTKQIETAKLEDSKVAELQGGNVRTPSLIKGELYMARTWKVIREDSDNPWMALRFLGSGHEGRTERVMHDVNPRIKDMASGDFYFFDHYTDGKIGELNASMLDDCLVVGDNNTRITFFAINGVTEQVKSAKSVKEKTTIRAPRAKKAAADVVVTMPKKVNKSTTASKSRKKANEEVTADAVIDEKQLEAVEETVPEDVQLGNDSTEGNANSAEPNEGNHDTTHS